MRFEVKRCLLVGFLVLNTLFVAWSLFSTGEKMEKLPHHDHARDHGEELFGAVTIKQGKGPPINSAKLVQEQRPPEPPPPSPIVPTGPHP
ncbi:hypothetical protein ACB092_04G209600 [Castanea dentata]